MLYEPQKSEKLSAPGQLTAKEVSVMTPAEILAHMKPLLAELETRRPRPADLGKLLAGSACTCAESPGE
jgi:hypothetical protein